MTRRITIEACYAFNTKTNFKLNNTEVRIVDGNPEMYLFGNKIAWVANGRLHWTMAGHPTVTTRERLNSLLREVIYQRNGKQFIASCTDGEEMRKEIDPDEVYVDEEFRP